MLSYQDVKIDPPSGNRVIEARGTGESGRGKSHSSGNRGMEKCRGTRGIGDLGFPVEPLSAGPYTPRKTSRVFRKCLF